MVPVQLLLEHAEEGQVGILEQRDAVPGLPELDPVLGRQGELQLAVQGQVGVRRIPQDQGHGEVRRDHRGAQVQGVRTDGRDDPGVHGRVQDRPARRKGVGGGAGGRGDDQAVRPHDGGLHALHPQPEVHDPGHGSLVDHRVVHHRLLGQDPVVPLQLRVEHDPLLAGQPPLEVGLDSLPGLAGGVGGQEAQGAQVHAQDRRSQDAHAPGRREQGAVASQYQAQVRCLHPHEIERIRPEPAFGKARLAPEDREGPAAGGRPAALQEGGDDGLKRSGELLGLGLGDDRDDGVGH